VLLSAPLPLALAGPSPAPTEEPVDLILQKSVFLTTGGETLRLVGDWLWAMGPVGFQIGLLSRGLGDAVLCPLLDTSTSQVCLTFRIAVKTLQGKAHLLHFRKMKSFVFSLKKHRTREL